MHDYRLTAQELTELRAAHRAARDVREAYRINVVILLGRGRTAADVADALARAQHGQAEAGRKEAHALKGAAASVMATAVQAGAARIEASVQRGDFAAAAAELAALENLFGARA